MDRVVNMCIDTHIYTHTHLVIMLPPRPKEYQKTLTVPVMETSIYAVRGA